MSSRFEPRSSAAGDRSGGAATQYAEPSGQALHGALSRRRFLISMLATSGALGLSGCTFPVPTPTVATATIAPGQPSTDLPIGVVLSLTGRYSREGALMRAGYELWADAARQAGGVKVGAGRRAVRLIIFDDESEPLNAGRQAERLAASERVRLWLGPFSSAISTAVASVADRVGALVVAPDASIRQSLPSRTERSGVDPRHRRSAVSRAGRPGRDSTATGRADRYPDRRRAGQRRRRRRLPRAGGGSRARPCSPRADGARLTRHLGPSRAHRPGCPALPDRCHRGRPDGPIHPYHSRPGAVRRYARAGATAGVVQSRRRAASRSTMAC